MSVPQAPEPSDSLTNCFFTIRFLSRIRRRLRLKSPNKDCKPAEVAAEPIGTDMITCEEAKGDHHDRDGDRNWMAALKKSVKMLHFGSWEEKEAAAREMKKLAEEDVKRRRTMAELGVIPPLVAMVGSEVAARQRLAVQALIELANGSFTNKALMVEAGILSRLPNNMSSLEETDKRELAELLLSISGLANSQFPLNSSRIIPTTVCILESSSSIETEELCLSTLYNLSSVLDNAPILISTGVVTSLTKLSSVKETAEKSLATLGNLVVTSAGRKALEQNPTVPEGLIEIMTWEEKPKCQELCAYILMILAHQSSLQRQKMAKAGIVQVLLEVALLGSPLAQKRAMKLLQWFKDERQTRMGPHSGPLQVGRIAMGSPLSEKDAEQGKRMMTKIVKQSLYKNMETITRRANGDASNLKALVVSSSSKSLPY
ncbi:U-box domain-containing protein 4-like [Salvia miltiorrhiza]|uniref:U-box domain-containing protein 4-like n=1 Tax=Salvia miltiorrhiza TaxID=226208 RepID=UPI0025ABA557|nr:U-box domain-containing protein 4-like [Salvia miltiorrhiza]